MDVDILLCEKSGPIIRRDHCAVNRCPCCGKKNFEVIAHDVDVCKAFAVLAGYIYNKDENLFKTKLLKEIEEWSEEEDSYIG